MDYNWFSVCAYAAALGSPYAGLPIFGNAERPGTRGRNPPTALFTDPAHLENKLMETSIGKTKTAAAIIGLAVLCATPAMAQTTGGGTSGTTAATRTDVRDVRDDRNWGWVGLLGLVGLAGLLRRDRNDVTTPRPSSR